MIVDTTGFFQGIKCKRKLDDRDYCGNSHQKPVEKGQPLAKRLRYSPRKSQAAAASLAARSVLEDTTLKQVNSAAPAAAGAASTGNKKSSPRKKSNMGTPSKAAAIIITEQIKQVWSLLNFEVSCKVLRKNGVKSLRLPCS